MHRWSKCPARDSNLRTMSNAYCSHPPRPSPRVADLSARSWDFCGICGSNEHLRGVSLDDKKSCYLRIQNVGGAGFEPATPAL